MDNHTDSQDKSNGVKDWFPAGEWRHVQTVVTKRSSELTFKQKLVWSWLMYKLRDNAPVTATDVERGTGIERHTVADQCADLMTLGLVRKDRGGYKAIRPVGEVAEWFVWHGDDFPGSLGKYKTLVRGPDAPDGYTPLTNAVYCLLVSLAFDDGRVIGQSIKGLAKMLEISKNTVKAAIETLDKAGLLKKDGNNWILIRPTTEHFRNWERVGAKAEPKPTAAPTPTSARPVNRQPVAGAALVAAYRSFPWLTPITEVADIAEYLPGFANQMIAAGYSQADVLAAWGLIFRRFHADPERLMVFVIGGSWTELWGDTQAAHDGKGRSSFGLLKCKIADMG